MNLFILKYLCRTKKEDEKMKKIVFMFLALYLMNTVNGQNFQVHYDFGKNRNYVTTTFEMFKPDNWGNSFIFVDFDYTMDKAKHPGMAYMEIARCFSFGKSPFSFQVEYNGGLMAIPAETGYSAFAINNAYLSGLDYGWHSADFTKFLNLRILYKYIAGKNPASFQLTGVWNLDFFNRKLSMNGFADFWREDNLNYTKPNGENLSEPTETRFVFMSEPQIWYNLTPQLSLGSEIELTSNFGSVDGFKVCPTIGIKWTFQ